MKNLEVLKAKKLFFKECHLAGRKYHDVDEVWEELKVGTKLTLIRDLNNRFDTNAVAVVYKKWSKDNESETYILGYIPKGKLIAPGDGACEGKRRNVEYS